MPSDNVELLKYPESIRTRPNMFVGELEDASLLLREVVDNSVDELYSAIDHKTSEGCNKIWINLSQDGEYIIADNGRGIPIKESKEKDITMAKLAVSNLSAGSKFKKNSIAIGMNGCFVGDTKIVVSDNSEDWYTKSIVDLASDYAGKYVKTSKGPRRIVMCGLTQIVKDVQLLEFSNGEKVECTQDHKFMLTNKSFRKARNLKVGDTLETGEDEKVTVTYSKSYKKLSPVPVYDISVDTVHNFKLASGPIVHNCGVSCVNALSEHFTIMSRAKLHNLDELPKPLKKKVPDQINDNTYYFCTFERGLLKEEGFTDYDTTRYKGENPSTITLFKPDNTIYRSIKARIPSTLQYVKFILEKSGHPSEIIVNGEPYKDSYKGFGFDLDCTIPTAEENAKNPNLRMMISVGFQDKLDPCQIVGSVNGLDCKAGFHIKLAQVALDKAFTRLFSNCNRTEFMGMNIGVVCLCNEPEFSSQTKERMSGADGFRCSERDGKHEIDILTKACMNMMKAHFEEFKLHEAKILEYMKSTEKIGRKELIKSSVLIAANTSRPEAFIPNKLLDCSTTNRQEAELILCFTGDTEILDFNFNKISFEELTRRVANNEKIYTYSCDSKGSIYPSKIIWAGVTGKASEVLKVTLDNGESFKCTPEHKFLMRSGEYKEARNLTEGESLMHTASLAYSIKVLKVETITYDTPIDVYCLRVDNELHNFPLADGIFAHNCEGNSAAGSLIKCRDPRIHAILPLRGWN